MKSFILTILFIITFSEANFIQGEQKSSSKDKLHLQENLKKIIVYGSDTCHYCLNTKTFLKERKIDFIYYDVDVNLTKQREMLVKMQKSGIRVDNLLLPVIHKNNKIFMSDGDFDAFLKHLID